MSKSFGIVEQKIEESDFFLTKVEETLNEFNIIDAQFYLSAFLSATRSITFTIQASISELDGFKEWYSKHQLVLKEDKLAKFFLEARNSSQKVGYYLIGGGSGGRTETGEYEHRYHFQYIPEHDYIPEEDVLEGCMKYFSTLLNLVVDCFVTFGSSIDPERCFTIENLRASGKPIEYFEVLGGYPEGYTNIPEFTEEDRINLIGRHQAKSNIDWVFDKYLGTNRFGEPVS